MKRKMSLADACDLVPDDLPDGAFFAMAHELAGAEYGEAWDELPGHPDHVPFDKKLCSLKKTVPCNVCGKKFGGDNSMRQHRAAAHSK